MIELDLKKIKDCCPGPLKNTLGYFAKNRIIHSSTFNNQYGLLDKYEELSTDRKKEIQFHLLKKTLIYAYEHCPYYKETFDNVNFYPYSRFTKTDFRRIPVLTKEIINRERDRLVVDGLKSYSARSGGTSGNPVEILFDYGSLYKERAFVYHYWARYGYDYKSSRLASFRDSNYGSKLFVKNPIYSELQVNPFMLDSIHIKTIVDAIRDYKADFLYGYPSSIAPFCLLMKKNNISIKNQIKAIFLISENLYPDQLNQIKDVFDCPVAMFYGHTEKAVFAERTDDVYHFNRLYGYTELIPSEVGNIICTGFINKKMPLIRYCVDDEAIVYKNGYNIVGHRENEFLYGYNDYRVSSTSLEFAHEDCFEKVIAYQFVQNEKGKAQLNIQTVEPLSTVELNAIKRIAEMKTNGIKVSINVVDCIPRTERGKYKIIIQNIKK